jgi:hypothetical protein
MRRSLMLAGIGVFVVAITFVAAGSDSAIGALALLAVVLLVRAMVAKPLGPRTR